MANTQAPGYYTFYLTFRCNLRCTMCFQRDLRNVKFDELSFDEIVTMFDRVRNLERVNLIGGEVFVRPDIFDILEYFDARDVITYITSNGALLDEAKIKRLLRLRHLLGITISLDAIGDTYQAIRLGRTNAEDILSTIKQLAHGTEVRVNSVLLLQNLDSFDPLIQAVAEAGAALLKVQFQIAHSAWVLDETNRRASAWLKDTVTCLYPPETTLWDVEVLQSAVERIEQLGQQYNLQIVFFPAELKRHLTDYAAETLWNHNWLQCEGQNRIPRMKVLPNGDIFFCEGLNVCIGNLTKQTPDEIWNTSRLNQFFERFDQTGGLPICGRCCRVLVGAPREVPIQIYEASHADR